MVYTYEMNEKFLTEKERNTLSKVIERTDVTGFSIEEKLDALEKVAKQMGFSSGLFVLFEKEELGDNAPVYRYSFGKIKIEEKNEHEN